MKELLYQLWLTALRGVSTVKIHRLREHFGSFAAVYDADARAYAEVEGLGAEHALANKNLDAARKILEDCDRLGITIVSYYGDGYPRRLRELDGAAPAQLYVKGTLPPVDQRLTVAVVGARRASLYGNACAAEISRDLARAGA
ncbi:MAG: DNA-processing protein DprA, partial [Clostridiales bacterium]|nr:DNA-processing protein DprA [Clostridiales bacterium]